MYARAQGRRCPDPRHWSEARGRRGHLALPGLPQQGEPPDYTQAEVIVLDDLGKVRPSEHSYQTLMTLIEHVISEGKPSS